MQKQNTMAQETHETLNPDKACSAFMLFDTFVRLIAFFESDRLCRSRAYENSRFHATYSRELPII